MCSRSCTRLLLLLLLVVGQIALVRSRSQLEAPGLEVGRCVHFRDRDRDRDSALLFSGVVPTELEQLV